MVITILVVTLIALMFWQEQMSSDYVPMPPHKPTKTERYIGNINKLIDQGHYSIVESLLARTKYSRDQLPWDYWKTRINTEVLRISKESERLASLKGLEKILES